MSEEDSGRALREPALVCDEAASRLHPSGFDPARFYIDCEFDGHGGALLSFAVVAEEGHSLYVIVDEREAPVFDPWVRDNVLSVIDDYGDADLMRRHVRQNEVGTWLRRFLAGCSHPVIIADSPVDIGRFCAAISTSEGGGWASCNYPRMTFEVHNVDCYPTALPGAVQHNAWWDAMALREKLAPVPIEYGPEDEDYDRMAI